MSGECSSPSLRTDARRNVERIRNAAVAVFREQGLSAPLEDVAAVARVSKATIFNRFGGRVGLVDAVVDEIVAAELLAVIDDARSVVGVRQRIRSYVAALRGLQYRIPAVNDVLLQEFPDSEQLMALCRVGSEFHNGLVAEGRAAGVLADHFSPEDFHSLTVDNAVALKFGRKPTWEDYERRTVFLLDGMIT